MEEQVPRATHYSETIGDFPIPCAVLEAGTRLITQQGMLAALGRANRGIRRSSSEVAKLPPFLAAKNLEPFIGERLVELAQPIRFKLPKGSLAYGYKAPLLPEICNVFVRARDVLTSKQLPTLIRCEMLLGGFATIGIIALIDESTGYDATKEQALSEILKLYLSDRLLEWAKTFPNQFYQEMFRLRGWDYDKLVTKRPLLTGKLTRDIVYERLPVDCLDELDRKNPKTAKGYRKHKHFQWLSEDWGNPTLRAHIYALIGMMRGAANWRQFYNQLERSFPKAGHTRMLPFDDDLTSTKTARFEPTAVSEKPLALPKGITPKAALKAFMKVDPMKIKGEK